ncbi:inositol phosphorylceramide synthase [Dactylosporangium sucinum]|uniref:Inositol phosphorylceramide synthase n=2 Tax=Dactylosporangium sucinum TaxID=1424081 RepID=A0A917TWL9_9ACTN|nr:inositol phosphorylceramide synthase [Dactylosporangium sucinum]
MASSQVTAKLKAMTITWEEPDTATRAATPRVALGRQIGIVTAAVAAYFLVRGATEAATDQALDNAGSVVALERRIGLFHESWLQDTFAGTPAVATFFNWVYIWGHWPVIIATLVWLARTNPRIYYRTRNAMLLSGGIGLFVFTLFPVAPPRLAELGLVDTVTETSDAYRVLQPAMFTNQYAAMPSLHVGWDLLIGLAIVVAARRPLVRLAGAVLPVLMVCAVVLTANHYIVDAIAGAALTTACWVYLVTRDRPAGPKGYAGWDGLRLT